MAHIRHISRRDLDNRATRTAATLDLIDQLRAFYGFNDEYAARDADRAEHNARLATRALTHAVAAYARRDRDMCDLWYAEAARGQERAAMILNKATAEANRRAREKVISAELDAAREKVISAELDAARDAADTRRYEDMLAASNEPAWIPPCEQWGE